jgi:replication-associated recombination protein RarA
MGVNNALLSRAQVCTLQPLPDDELGQLYERAASHLNDVTLDADALALLKGFAELCALSDSRIVMMHYWTGRPIVGLCANSGCPHRNTSL